MWRLHLTLTGLLMVWIGGLRPLHADGPTVPKRLRTVEGLKQATTQPAPQAFIKGNQIRLYFTDAQPTNIFGATWNRFRLDGRHDTYYLAKLHLISRPVELPTAQSHWQKVQVFGNEEWTQLTREVAERLTPREPRRGCYLQFANTERIFYRDESGVIQATELKLTPADITISQRYNAQEFARTATQILSARFQSLGIHPQPYLYLLKREGRAIRFVLFDLPGRRCVLLLPPRVGEDPRELPHPLGSVRILSTFLLESHGWAILKNPISSAGRLLNFSFQTAAGLLRPGTVRSRPAPPLRLDTPEMNLTRWEQDLDHLTGRPSDRGYVRYLIDGIQFFPRFEQNLNQTRSSIDIRICIFDNDDIAVEIADLLKARSRELPVKVLLDRLSSQSSAMAPPATAMPENFVQPKSILRYLRQDSKVKVHSFLNTWFTADHAKVLILDDRLAYIGGMNFGREYRYEWHDFMVELEGPIVAPLKRDFQRAWAHSGLLGDLAYAMNLFLATKPKPAPVKADMPYIRRLYTRTGDMEFRGVILAALRRAQHHVYLENPYLYDSVVISELVRARRRGVEVRVILPEQNDLTGGESSNFVTANYLWNNGIRVYIYPGMTHVKALMVDGWACFGSSNFNKLSLCTNQELNIATSDSSLVKQLREQLFELDFSQSYELHEPVEVSWTDHFVDMIVGQF